MFTSAPGVGGLTQLTQFNLACWSHTLVLLTKLSSEARQAHACEIMDTREIRQHADSGGSGSQRTLVFNFFDLK